VGWLVEVSVTEKHAISIFMAEDGDLIQKNIISIVTAMKTLDFRRY
jgi:hypothetical protein